MPDPSKFPIEFQTTADTSGAEAAQQAIRDTEAAAAEAAQTSRERFDAERARDRERYEEKRKQQEEERGKKTDDPADRTAAAADAINTRERAEAIRTLVSGLGEASRKAREFAGELRDINPELAELAEQGADAASGLSRIGEAALSGFAAGGAPGAAIAATGSALMYMVEGLFAAARAENEFSTALAKGNEENARGIREGAARAEALALARESTRESADAEELLSRQIADGAEALESSNTALRERLELMARESKDQAEIIRLEEDLERKRIAADGTMSGEEKAKATADSRERERSRIAALEDETRNQKAGALTAAAWEATGVAKDASDRAAGMRAAGEWVLGKDERKSVEEEAEAANAAKDIPRRDHLRRQLEVDERMRSSMPGIGSREDVDAAVAKLEATAKKALESEAAARREIDRIQGEQTQAERLRPMQREGDRIDRDRDVSTGRRRDLEEDIAETEQSSRGAAGRISGEAAAAAQKVKTDIGRQMLDDVRKAFADGVLTDNEKSSLAGTFKAIAGSRDNEMLGTLRDLIAGYTAQQQQIKSLREAVKALRDRS